jgi:membrane-bound lytic murein transglycosylase D
MTNTTGESTFLPARRATLVASMAVLLALGGCATFKQSPPEQQAPPPKADTVTKLPPVHWKDMQKSSAEEKTEPESTTEPSKPESLWARMRAHFELPDVDNDRIDAKLNWYASHPKYVDRVAERAKPYLYYIVEQLNARDMPVELALLPVFESAYNPFAYSGSGASGLWQFMPVAAHRFALKQSWWYDGRRDVVASTRAALDYLQYLHGKFDNWVLAVAAYNSGGGRVARAIRSNKRRGKPTDFWHLDLPRQTRAYVPCLIAIRDIIKKPKKYNVTLPSVPNKPYLARVPVKSQIDIARAAKMAGLSLEQMYLLNAGLNRWATAPGKTQYLLIPMAERADFVANLAALPKTKRVQWAHHKIRHGETLSTIAHHYGTTVTVLERVNHLDGSTIRTGHYLMVPNAATDLDQNALSEIRSLRHVELARQGRKTHYVVRAGDSLWAIGRRFNVSTRELARWNHMSTHATLRVGQRLVLWRHGRPRGQGRKVHYTVHTGDSLWAIGQRYGVSTRDLARWNGIGKRSTLHIGEKLVIWASGTHGHSRRHGKVQYTVRTGDSLWTIGQHYGVSTRELARWNGIDTDDPLHAGDKLAIWPHGHAPSASVKTVSADADDLRHEIHYTVHAGDSLWSISNQFDVDVNKLANWNALSLHDYLHPGQSLVLYVNEQSASTSS